MSRSISITVFLVITVVCGALSAYAQGGPSPQAPASKPFLLGPPKTIGPVVVRARFDFHDINGIDDQEETFEIAGVLTLKWNDPRESFDPAVAGVDEKIFQGDEMLPRWLPQIVLVNEAGLYQKNGVTLRIQPDGTSTLIETLNAAAKVELNMRLFPFDSHQLEAIFEVLGFDHDEVLLQVETNATDSSGVKIQVPQWTITDIKQSVRDRLASYSGRRGVSSAFIVSVDVQRNSFFIIRLIMIPLAVIVLLSFSVFWMDRSSLGDRIQVSFMGILTSVAYQFVISEDLPHISYFTLMNAFLNLSFLTMCATVVINLVVGALDKRQKFETGDLVDRRCRWLFPFIYFGLTLVMIGVAFLFF